MSTADDTAHLKAFAEMIGSAGLPRAARSHWASNHHILMPLWPKADKLLSPEEFQRFARYILMDVYGVPPAPKTQFPIFVDAYRETLAAESIPASRRRHILLFLFGFDENGALPEGPTASAAEYEAYRKFLHYAGSFSHLPGQRAKAKKFTEYSAYSGRILAALRHIGYLHDRMFPDDESLYSYTDLTFWAMMLTALMTPHGADILGDFLDKKLQLPRKDEQLGILHETAKTAMAISSPDQKLAALARKLAAHNAAKRAQTESAQLNHALDLKFPAEEEWAAGLVIPDASHGLIFKGARVAIDLRNTPQFAWHVGITDLQDRRYSEHVTGVTQNDMELTPLGAGNLAQLPQWLAATMQTLGMTLAFDKGSYSCGRNRQAARKLREWLGG